MMERKQISWLPLFLNTQCVNQYKTINQLTHLLDKHSIAGLSVQIGLLGVQKLPEWLVQILSNVRQKSGGDKRDSM